jgi:hypothetical protein
MPPDAPRFLFISPSHSSDMTMVLALIEAAEGDFDTLIANRGCMGPASTLIRHICRYRSEPCADRILLGFQL